MPGRLDYAISGQEKQVNAAGARAVAFSGILFSLPGHAKLSRKAFSNRIS
jgi:hypothetical protein